MRRILALLTAPIAVVAATVVLAAPVSAQGLPCEPVANGNGAASCTIHASNIPMVMDVPAMPCPNGTVLPGGHFVASLSGVFHITLMGDQAWATSTLQGNFTLTQTTNGVTYAGHIETWFGESFNVNNVVFHATLNIAAHGLDGSTLGLHIEMQFTTNANQQIVVNSTHLTC